MTQSWAATTTWNGEEFGLVASAIGLMEVALPNEWGEERRVQYQENPEMLRLYLQQFELYWNGQLKNWSVPLDMRGTPFQKAVWTALLDIPYGDLATYGDIARRIGRPSAVRAVAAAVGKNPLAIVVPCHRVIGANGALTGYSGGLRLKERLLRLEGVTSVKPIGHSRFDF